MKQEILSILALVLFMVALRARDDGHLFLALTMTVFGWVTVARVVLAVFTGQP